MLRPFQSFQPQRFIVRHFSPTIMWDKDIVKEEEVERSKRSRFYIPPPYTDAQLLGLTPAIVSEWPKGRVVWALGRLGWLKQSVPRESVSALLARIDTLVDTLNTRDLVRVLQALAYLPAECGSESIIRISKIWCSKLSETNDLFFVSGLYGYLKFINRRDWKLTLQCEKTTKYLLSELVHRRKKLHASDFLDVASAVLTSKPSVRDGMGDWINQIIKHGIEENHVRDIATISRFFKSFSGHNLEPFFVSLNEKFRLRISETLKWKSNNDLIEFGFYPILQNLLTHANIIKWVNLVSGMDDPRIVIAEEILRQRGLSELVSFDQSSQNTRKSQNSQNSRNTQNSRDSQNRLFVESVSSTSSVSSSSSCASSPWIEAYHMTKVLKHMGGTVFCEQFVGPFFCRLVSPNQKLVLTWKNSPELLPPHEQNVAIALNRVKAVYLQSIGWRLVELDRLDFASKDLEANNSKFWQHMHEFGLSELDGRKAVVEERVQEIVPLPPTVRIRRESKRKENKLKATLRQIGKQWRRKANRRKIKI